MNALQSFKWLCFCLSFMLLQACSDEPSAVKDVQPMSTTTSTLHGGTPAAQSGLALLALFPQTITSSAWNQGGYQGATKLTASLGIPFHYLESVQFSDVERFKAEVGAEIKRHNIRLVLAHGGQFVNVTSELAKAFPRVNFIVNSDCAGNNINLGCLSFDWDELGQLTGIAAGLKSRTGQIGFIGGMRLNILQQMAQGIRHGAQHINPNIELTEVYLNSWNDDAQALIEAEKMIKKGVDVVAINADPASLKLYPIFAQAGIAIIGRDLQLYANQPKTLLANVRLETSRLIEYGLSQILQGRWEGKLYRFGIDDQVQQVELTSGALEPEKQQRFDTLAQQLLSRQLELTH